jgi:hypothetical protein
VERPGLVGSAPLANARREGRRWPRRSEGESSEPRGEFGVAREVGAAAGASRRASRGGSGLRTCSRRGGGDSSRDLECSVNPRASRCPSVALDPPLPPSRLVSRPRGLVEVDSTSDGERLWASVEGGGATASSGVSQRLGLPRRFLPDAPKESWTDPADSSGIRTAGPDGGTAGGGSGLTGAAGLAGVPQKPNPPESAFAGLSDDEPPPIPKNLEMASQDELFFGVGLRSEASEAGALGAWGVGGAASCPGESPWLFSGGALLFLGIGLGEGVFSLSARFCQWSDMSGFCGPSLDRLEWFAQCGPWNARPSQRVAGSRSRWSSMDFRSSDRLLPTSGTPLGRPDDLSLPGAGVRVERERRVNRRATDQRLSPGPQTHCPPHRKFDAAVISFMIADFHRFRKPNRPHIPLVGRISGVGGGTEVRFSLRIERVIAGGDGLLHSPRCAPRTSGIFCRASDRNGGRFRGPARIGEGALCVARGRRGRAGECWAVGETVDFHQES